MADDLRSMRRAAGDSERHINRETDGPMRTITVRATSVDGSYSEQTFTIAITDVDEFDTSSPIDVDVAANSVAENSASGTIVGITALSVDADATNNTITMQLSDARWSLYNSFTNGCRDGRGWFTIELREASSHSITVRATSSDGSIAFQTLNIAITDVNEAPTASAMSFTTNNVQTLNVSGNILDRRHERPRR